mmetsp:Transcript_20369/g.51459  ORF Transcript_20369/g.51459 Transcript_20369/m.51459 type:complete len:82 (+) Transcript_20369:4337-4582(+)
MGSVVWGGEPGPVWPGSWERERRRLGVWAREAAGEPGGGDRASATSSLVSFAHSSFLRAEKVTWFMVADPPSDDVDFVAPS